MRAGDYLIVNQQKAHARAERLHKLISPELARHLERRELAKSFLHSWRDAGDDQLWRSVWLAAIRKTQLRLPQLGTWK